MVIAGILQQLEKMKKKNMDDFFCREVIFTSEKKISMWSKTIPHHNTL